MLYGVPPHPFVAEKVSHESKLRNRTTVSGR